MRCFLNYFEGWSCFHISIQIHGRGKQRNSGNGTNWTWRGISLETSRANTEKSNEKASVMHPVSFEVKVKEVKALDGNAFLPSRELELEQSTSV